MHRLNKVSANRACYFSELLSAYLLEKIPASIKSIPAKVKDSQSPVRSLASFILLANLGMCSNKNHPPIIIPLNKAAQYLTLGISKPMPPAIKQMPQQ